LGSTSVVFVDPLPIPIAVLDSSACKRAPVGTVI
jgi:hypothetical protein